MRTTVLVLLLLPNLAAAQTSLVWKFKPGDVFVYETVSKIDERAVSKGQTLKQEIHSTWVYRFEVTKASPEAATLHATFENVIVQHMAGTSKADDKLIERAKGAMLTLTVSPRGEIAAMDGYDRLIDKIADKREAIAKVFRQRFPEAAVKRWLQEVLVVLPKDSVAAGSRWQREEAPMILSTLGQMAVTVSAVHDDLDRADNHRLSGTLAGKYQLPTAPAEAVRVTGGSLTLEKGKWECTFDNERGRVLHQKTTFELGGELTVDSLGAMTPVELTSRREWTTKLLPRK